MIAHPRHITTIASYPPGQDRQGGGLEHPSPHQRADRARGVRPPPRHPRPALARGTLSVRPAASWGRPWRWPAGSRRGTVRRHGGLEVPRPHHSSPAGSSRARAARLGKRIRQIVGSAFSRWLSLGLCLGEHSRFLWPSNGEYGTRPLFRCHLQRTHVSNY